MLKVEGLELGVAEFVGLGAGVGELDGAGMAGATGNAPRADLLVQLAQGIFHRPPDPLPG